MLITKDTKKSEEFCPDCGDDEVYETFIPSAHSTFYECHSCGYTWDDIWIADMGDVVEGEVEE